MNRHPSWISGKAALRPRPPSLPPVLPSNPPSPEPEPTVQVDPCPQPVVPVVDLGLALEVARLTEEKVALEDRLARATVRMAKLRRDMLESTEPELVKLAMAIAERVVGRELAVDPALVVGWAKEAMQTLGASDDVVIAVASDVAAATPAEAWAEVAEVARVQTDATLPDGAVEARSPLGRVAAGAQARLSAVGQAMGVGDP